jgi:hypothetical protein
MHRTQRSSHWILCCTLALGVLVINAPAWANDAPQSARLEPPPVKAAFTAEPITDGAIVSLSLGFGALSELVLGTGEIVPQQPQGTSKLLGLDRVALKLHDSKAGPISTVGVIAALGYAVSDVMATGFGESLQAGLVDGVLYAETLSLTWAATNIAKLAVRRPRPRAYQEQQRLYAKYGRDKAPNISETDAGMSFFSGHTAITAAVASTATYLAFARSPNTARPWITLGVGVGVTTFVAIERVRAGAHFPTDVIAAAMAGIGIGLLVPHLHREATSKGLPVWIGFGAESGGGQLSVVGAF